MATKKKEKIEKKEIIQQLSLYVDPSELLKGSLKQAAENILNLEKRLRVEHALIKNNPDMFFEFRIRLEQPAFEESAEIVLIGARLETDDEFNKRIEKSVKLSKAAKESAKKRKNDQDKKDFETYKKLKAKFGEK